MDHNSKHYFLRSEDIKEIENTISCESQEENTRDDVKYELSVVNKKDENELEQSSHLFEKMQSHIISSKDSINDLNSVKVLENDSKGICIYNKKTCYCSENVEVKNENKPVNNSKIEVPKNETNFNSAFTQEIKECEISVEVFEESQSNAINSEALLDTMINKNTENGITKNVVNDDLNKFETLSIKNYADKTVASVSEEKLLSIDTSKFESQKNDDEMLGKNGTTNFKMWDTERKRKKPNFLCPRKKKKESDDKNNIKPIVNGNSSKEFCEAKDQSKTKKCKKAEQSLQEIKSDNMEKENISSNKNSVNSKINDALINEQKNKNVKGTDNAFFDIFDTNIPLIGTKVIQNDDKPFPFRYDLAIEKNKKRFRFAKEEALNFKNGDLKPWEIEAKKSEKEKKDDAKRKKLENLRMAHDITKVCIYILKLLNEDHVDEKRIAILFAKFILASITPTSLLYVPHFVHTISLCRGSRCFSNKLRMLADECYKKCHAMFPVPLGSNFESVYSAQVKKFLPESFDSLHDTPLLYGDVSDIVESSDDERSTDDKENTD